jgi:SAM-dependent methyltransferase
MPDKAESLKSMKLYDQVERIHNELRALGIAEDAPLTVADLAPFDSYHYLGAEAVDSAAAALGLTRDSRLLDVGSGIGGPARHIAQSIGCHVTALELQADLAALSVALNARCGLTDRIETVRGDILDGPPDGRVFDALMSLLVFIHIGDRRRLLSQCLAALKPGGRIYIEDFRPPLETRLQEGGEPEETLRRRAQYTPPSANCHASRPGNPSISSPSRVAREMASMTSLGTPTNAPSTI